MRETVLETIHLTISLTDAHTVQGRGAERLLLLLLMKPDHTCIAQ